MLARHHYTYAKNDENKYIWSAEEVFGFGDTRCDYIHQFRGYATDKGWNITVQAMIPSTRHGYRWVTTQRYFKKSRFPNAKTVKQVIVECIKLPYMIDPLTTQYEGYKIVKSFNDPECPMSQSEILKLSQKFKDKYGKGWTNSNEAAQDQMGTEMYLRGYRDGKWDAVEYEVYCNNFQGGRRL